jgi:hypothetical protein
MIVASLLADLEQSGARLSSCDPEREITRLMVTAPAGTLTETLRGAIRRHKAELLSLVIELEETRAIIEENGATPEEADRGARAALHISTVTPDGGLYLMDLVEHSPMMEAFDEVFGGGEILDVWRARDEVTVS